MVTKRKKKARTSKAKAKTAKTLPTKNRRLGTMRAQSRHNTTGSVSPTINVVVPLQGFGEQKPSVKEG